MSAVVRPAPEFRSIPARFCSLIRGGSLRRAVGLDPPLIYAGVFPQLTGDLEWIDAGRLPPSSLVAGAMDRAMMDTAEGHGEFVAGLAAERARLQVAKVMRVGWLATADEARLLGDRAKVLPVAIATRRGNREHALVDAGGLVELGACCRNVVSWGSASSNCGSIIVRGSCSDEASSASLCSKASSTSLASGAVSLFLAASASRAQLAASSAEAMLPISASSLSRRAADCSASMIAGGSPFVTSVATPIAGGARRHPRLIGQSA